MSLHALEEEDFGPYTSPEVKAALCNPERPAPPIAVHIEGESDNIKIGERMSDATGAPIRSRHGRICSAVLEANLQDTDNSGNCAVGLLDINPYVPHKPFFSLNERPLAVVTISYFCRNISYPTAPSPDSNLLPFSSLDSVLAFRSAGNKGHDWRAQMAEESLSHLTFMPSFFRVGEYGPGIGTFARPTSSCGPAFVCAHPYIDDPSFSTEIDGYTLSSFLGTSYSTPHAGNMVVACTDGLRDISLGDVAPAVLLAAAAHPPGTGEGTDVVTTAAGFAFDCLQQGLGFLERDALQEQIARFRKIAVDSQRALYLSELFQTRVSCSLDEPRNEASLRLPDRDACIYGPIVGNLVVNLSYLLRFAKDPSEPLDESQVPEFVSLRHEATGTEIRGRLLVHRDIEGYQSYDLDRVYAGLSTAGFFGEPLALGGIWKISLPEGHQGYPLAEASLLMNTLLPESPGAKLLRAYQEAARGAAPDSGFLAPGTRDTPSPKGGEREVSPRPASP